MLKRDHPKFKVNSISATGASKSECRENHRVKAFGRLRKKSDAECRENHQVKAFGRLRKKSNSECRQTHRVKAFLRLRKKYDVEQVAEAYMLQRDNSKFKGNSISATGASKSECRETHRVKAFLRLRKKYELEQECRENHRVKAFGRLQKKSDVGQVAEAYMLKRDHPKFKGNSISATGASKSECRETHRIKAFLRLRKKYELEQNNVAGAYMIKRITRNSKATEFKGGSGTGASMSECRENHRVKAFGRLQKKSDVGQVAEAYMLKRDHPKFKGNSISATGASKSECRETHRIKAFLRLRKKYDLEQV
ncbi:hypothetical protein D5086_033959 [Populus alba]|uniref:Uncharacterized protein n=1 Tax=Populus alba TaxID=43335 RepID=A0ACC4AIB6_POPAL